MLRLTAAIAATLLAGSAEAGTRTVQITPVSEAPQGCSLTVSFGSYAMGIDARAFERIGVLLSHDRGVKAIEQHRWGREGEVTLCARTRRGADARRLFVRMRDTLPAKPRGPITITAGPNRYVTPPSRR
jgi:hypothetical protein